jgi:hypothetical protein
MTSKRSNWQWAFGVVLLVSCIKAFAQTDALACWTTQVSPHLIDVDGTGTVQGAWSVPHGLLHSRLQSTTTAQTLLLPGYDVLAVRRVCTELQAAGLNHGRILFGGRERLLAQQGVPAWDWLLVSTDSLAANLLSGELSGWFIGKGKTVVGQGLSKSPLTDPSAVAAKLIDLQRTSFQPRVLFVDAEHQQPFFDFFSNNPLPGVFLSFEEAEKVRDVLNKHASFSANEQARPLNYYCD